MAITLASAGVGLASSTYNTVAYLYFHSYTIPHEIDSIVGELDTEGVFDRKFFSCLHQIRNAAGIEGTNEDQFCSVLPVDQAANCRATNWAVGVYLWTIDIESVIRKEKVWRDTLVGQAAFYGRQYCEALSGILGPASCRIQDQATLAISQLLICR